jgi:tetratricopeptide (TPR) repeat protein
MNKKFKIYSKTEEVYFDTELFFLLIPAVAACVITYFVLYFLGTIPAILFNVFIAFSANFFVYAYGSTHVKKTLSFLISTLVTSCVLFFFDYGVYTLVTYQKTGAFNKIYFLVWILILIGVPVLYYIRQYSRYYYKERSMALTYLKVFLRVHHDRELLMVIDNIQFVNLSNKTMSNISLEKPPPFYSEEELFRYRDDMDIEAYLNRDIFHQRIEMPMESNWLFMSWYSITEDRYYDIEVPFPFEKLVIEQEKYPANVSPVLRGKKTKPLHLHIHANGGIRIFNEDSVVIDIPKSTPTDISAEERKRKIDYHRASHNYYRDAEAFSKLIEKIKSSGDIEERYFIKNKPLLWGTTITGLKGKNYLEIGDVAFKKYKIEISDLTIPEPRFLPRKIQMVYRGYYLYDWCTLYINSQKLYQTIVTLTGGDENIPVVFELVFDNESETHLQFTLTVNNDTFLFSDWSIKINKSRQQDMEDHLLDVDEDLQKRALYKEAWELVAEKKYDLAQEKCDAIIEIDPRYGFAYFLEVRLLWYKEGFDACYAQKDYFIAKAHHDKIALAHIYNSYGCILDQEERFEESLQYFEKAILTNEKEGMYLCNKAEICCKLKDPSNAVKFAKEAKKAGYDSRTLNAILESNGLHYL